MPGKRSLTTVEIKKLYDILSNGPVEKRVIKKVFKLNDATFSSFMFVVTHQLKNVWEDAFQKDGKRVVYVGVNDDIDMPEFLYPGKKTRGCYENIHRN